MQLNVTGHHVEVTDALREQVETKMQKIERHFDHVTNAHVILTVEKQEHKAEATLHVSGKDLFARASSRNMYAAIDDMIDKLDRQIRHHKDRITEHHKRA